MNDRAPVPPVWRPLLGALFVIVAICGGIGLFAWWHAQAPSPRTEDYGAWLDAALPALIILVPVGCGLTGFALLGLLPRGWWRLQSREPREPRALRQKRAMWERVFRDHPPR